MFHCKVAIPQRILLIVKYLYFNLNPHHEHTEVFFCNLKCKNWNKDFFTSERLMKKTRKCYSTQQITVFVHYPLLDSLEAT